MYLRITLEVPEQPWVAERQVAGGEKGSGVTSPQQGQGFCHLLPALPPLSLSFPAALRSCKVISIHLVQLCLYHLYLYLSNICISISIYLNSLTCVVLSGSLCTCALQLPKWILLLPSAPCSCMTQDAGIIWVSNISNIHGKLHLCLTNMWTTLIEMAAISP